MLMRFNTYYFDNNKTIIIRNIVMLIKGDKNVTSHISAACII
jgi:hypothetical protein